MTFKEEVLEKLSLVQDEPEEKELFFRYNEFADQITQILIDYSVKTPFVIGIHGDWGSGKTSLILQIQKKLQQEILSDSDKKRWKIIRFDAWEYERMDIVSSLFYKIALEYQTTGGKLKEFATSMVTIFTDIALRATSGLSFEELQKHLENLQEEIPTIKQTLEDIVGESRLVVFIDDLDRCHVDNVLSMLEAVKMFLSSKNVIFVIAVDMSKIERAWQLRYNSEIALVEGKEHTEKIFQLKLSLPPKETIELEKYVEKMCGSLSNNEKSLLVHGCPSNPRKIKRIVNLAYFVLKNTKDDEFFDKKVPLVILWCMLTNISPVIAKFVKEDPETLIQMALIATSFPTKQEVIRQKANLKQVLEVNRNLTLPRMALPSDWPRTNSINGIIYAIENDQNVLDFLRTVGEFYNLSDSIKNNNMDDFTKKWNSNRSEITEKLQEIIYSSTLVGD